MDVKFAVYQTMAVEEIGVFCVTWILSLCALTCRGVRLQVCEMICAAAMLYKLQTLFWCEVHARHRAVSRQLRHRYGKGYRIFGR